jgi:hypothetical protein
VEKGTDPFIGQELLSAQTDTEYTSGEASAALAPSETPSESGDYAGRKEHMKKCR